MKYYWMVVGHYIIIVWTIVLTSCNAQKTPETNSTMLKTTTEKTAPKKYKDSLFEYEGQLCQHVRCMYEDQKGDLWMGTNVYGLMYYNGDTLIYYNEKDGIGRGRINQIEEDEKGNLWFATGDGLLKYDGTSFTNFKSDDPNMSNAIWSMVRDEKGVFWLGTNKGVMQFDGINFTAFPIPKIAVKDTTSMISYDRISAITLDQSGVFWFGTDGFGICTYNPKLDNGTGEPTAFTHITKENGFTDNNIGSLFTDSKGNVWVGTYFGGLSRFDGNQFTNFTKNGMIDGLEVGGFYEDDTGRIWFAAENEGIYYYEGKLNDKRARFTKYTKADGLPSQGILCFLKDRKERFWLGGWLGLFQFNESEKAFSVITKKDVGID